MKHLLVLTIACFFIATVLQFVGNGVYYFHGTCPNDSPPCTNYTLQNETTPCAVAKCAIGECAGFTSKVFHPPEFGCLQPINVGGVVCLTFSYILFGMGICIGVGLF